jgi:flagellar secretion chaperone FliS
MKHPASAYRQFSVQGNSPLGLVVMLYDGAIAALRRAAGAIENRDVQQKSAQLNRAGAIIAQLEGTLNFEKGGEVAKTLKSLYVYARAQMLKASLENSAEVLQALIDKMARVREAWSEAEHRPSTAAAESAPTAGPGQPGSGEEPEPRRSPPAPGGRESPYSPYPASEPGGWRVLA